MLNVFTASNKVGELFQSTTSSKFIFSYSATALPNEAVSLTMPVINEQYDFWHGLHPIFEMNLPEGILLEKLKTIYRKQIINFSDLDLLKIVGRNQIGRITFSAEPDKNSVIDAIGLNLTQFKTYAGTEELLESLLLKYGANSGIAGVQPKIMVLDTGDTTNPKLSELDRLTYKDTTHIIKSWSEGSYPELATNEYFCMLVAKKAGLKTPEIELTNNGKFLIIKRFDLIDNTYYGFEDFCVLQAKRTCEKYDSSYEQIARSIKNNLVGESTINLKSALFDYFKSLVVNVLLRNGDAHLKNYGLIYKDTSSIVNLAPIYDIVTTTVYLPKDIMALTLNGSKRWASRDDLLAFATKSCMLSNAQASQIFEEVITAIKQVSELLMQEIELNHKVKDVGLRMLSIWHDSITSF
ncbi:MAG: type II toxin-antitoxin system HipA family toxin [Neisseriales bacterium]|nr:MAG: type II toxin-antitoxin system HipA family toxin [Neisseriales bacterium]